MKVFVTGVTGQLGYDVMKELAKRNHICIGSSNQSKKENKLEFPYYQLDITDKNAVDRVLDEVKPDAVVHCAAWTAVDAAEEPENYDTVMRINKTGTLYIAEACKRLDAKMVYISTDYVFDGQGEEPWQADDTHFAPLNVYGESKLAGEKAVAETLEKFFVVRIAWVFGINGNNFIKTMLNVGKKYNELRVVNDQIGTPTYTYDLARLLVDMVESEKYGYYHATNEGGYISWYDFACEIFKQAGYDTKVTPVSTEEYGLSKAKRPFNSRLDKSKLSDNGFKRLRPWENAVKSYLEKIEVTR